jgi:archaellum component FlaC
MDQELRSMLETILDHQEAFKKDMNTRFDGVDGRLEAISSQLDRIEPETNDDVVAVLESISSKLETLATKEDIDYLAGQLGKHELEIDRLKRVK